jgi:hypothetical protein
VLSSDPSRNKQAVQKLTTTPERLAELETRRP